MRPLEHRFRVPPAHLPQEAVGGGAGGNRHEEAGEFNGGEGVGWGKC